MVEKLTVGNWIQLVIAILYGGTIVATLYVSMREIRNVNEKVLMQTKKMFFAEYTKRYQEIIINMPDNVFAGTAPINDTTLKYMRLYYDLCSEEFHLYNEGLVPKDVWDNWVEGMRITTNLQLYRQCWDRLKGQYNEEFWKYFEKNIINLKNV